MTARVWLPSIVMLIQAVMRWVCASGRSSTV